MMKNDINKMDKNKLEKYTLKEFGVDLDKRKGLNKLREQVKKLISAKKPIKESKKVEKEEPKPIEPIEKKYECGEEGIEFVSKKEEVEPEDPLCVCGTIMELVEKIDVHPVGERFHEYKCPGCNKGKTLMGDCV